MYEKLNFRTGQVLVADDLNHMEEGIAAAMNAGGIVAITWSELRKLRNEKGLKTGSFYRITDYVTTTAQANTKSAGHQFDVVVLALSNNVLAEKAYAALHDGDTYFSEHGAKLEAWQIWYCLDNNAERFAWADAENGKGVIYRMIDEWNNDCPYDFKNIIYVFKKSFMYNQWGGDHQFMRDSSLDKVIDGTQYYGYSSATTPSAWSEGKCWVTDENVTIETQLYNAEGSAISYGGTIYNISNETSESYTFNEGALNDFSLEGEYCYGNTILAWDGGLNKIVFKTDKTYQYQGQPMYNCHSNSFGTNCHSNSFGTNCHSNGFGNGCYSNSFGNGCEYNSFGNGCYSNSFGANCHSNGFGTNCHSNGFGTICEYNSFGNGCAYNSFGTNCHYNSFGNTCTYNSFGNGCSSNSFGNGCSFNSFGTNCHSNSFGNTCEYNSFGNLSQSNELKAYYRYITFGEGVQHVTLLNETEGGYENQVQNYKVANSTTNIEVDVDRNNSVEKYIGVDSTGEVKVFNLADLLNK